MTIEACYAIISFCVDMFCEFFGARMEGMAVLRELMNQEKVVGVKQSRRAIREGRAVKVLLGRNADPALTEPIAQLCRENGIAVEEGFSMEELGKAAGIQVGAAVVAVLR